MALYHFNVAFSGRLWFHICMKNEKDQIQKIIDLIVQMPEGDRAILKERLKPLLTQPKNPKGVENVLTSKDSGEKSTKRTCPHCRSSIIKYYGKFRGKQRFKCNSCSKTFTSTTNTPLFRSHHPDKWDEFISCMVEGLSVEKAARKLGINAKTAFSWRHKILREFRSSAHLSGIAEADETFFLYSEKGDKTVSQRRKPRKRGGKANTPGISDDHVPVVVSQDREGELVIGVAGRGRISVKDVEKILSEYLDSEATFCTDSHSSFRAFAKAHGIKYVPINVSKGRRVVKKIFHIQNVNNSHARLKKWMVRFNGVSTKYLQNYMNWFCLLEETKELSSQNEQFACKIIRLNFSENSNTKRE